MLSQIYSRNFERVIFFSEGEARGIIAIHSTTLGPALGGCRLREYQSEEAALNDVLLLAEGMTYKASLAELNLGGGKAVLFKSAKISDRKKLFETFGEIVGSLNGMYITAEDLGTTAADMDIVASKTIYVRGTSKFGDPSPYTALGVVEGIKACLNFLFGTEDLTGRKILIQGVGAVGQELVKILAATEANLIISDVDESKTNLLRQQFSNIQLCDPSKIYDIEGDIFCPSAVGQVINKDTAQRLKVKAIAGAANNQLDDPSTLTILSQRKIIYVPDFVVNAGGLIKVAHENANDQNSMIDKIKAIKSRVTKILKLSQDTGATTLEIALDLAKQRLEQAKNLKQSKN
jgi:leucine dehydrogenase